MLFPEMVNGPVVITNSQGHVCRHHGRTRAGGDARTVPPFAAALASQRSREWSQDAIGLQGNRMIAGSRVLVIGLGAIGAAVAQRMAALGATVTGVRRTRARTQWKASRG